MPTLCAAYNLTNVVKLSEKHKIFRNRQDITISLLYHFFAISPRTCPTWCCSADLGGDLGDALIKSGKRAHRGAIQPISLQNSTTFISKGYLHIKQLQVCNNYGENVMILCDIHTKNYA